MSAAVQAIEERKKLDMKWQLSLTMLAQPAFTEEAAREKADAVMEVVNVLSGEEEEFVPMDDTDTIALLAMANRFPIR